MSRVARHTSGVERHRLDSALVTAGQSADAVTRAQIAAFDNILRQRRRKTAQGSSLRDEIESLTMPEISDPGIFAAGRMTDLLAHVITEILPQLEMSEDVQAITQAMLQEEIDSQRDIRERISDEGGAA